MQNIQRCSWGMVLVFVGCAAAADPVPADQFDKLRAVIKPQTSEQKWDWSLAKKGVVVRRCTSLKFRQERRTNVVTARGELRPDLPVVGSRQAAGAGHVPTYRSTTCSTGVPAAASRQAARSTSRWWSKRMRAMTSDRLVVRRCFSLSS